MHDNPATNATFIRVERDSFSVKAMNDGTTASGLTIVISAVNDSRATFQSGISLSSRAAQTARDLQRER